jgi:hypothetical protein
MRCFLSNHGILEGEYRNTVVRTQQQRTDKTEVMSPPDHVTIQRDIPRITRPTVSLMSPPDPVTTQRDIPRITWPTVSLMSPPDPVTTQCDIPRITWPIFTKTGRGTPLYRILCVGYGLLSLIEVNRPAIIKPNPKTLGVACRFRWRNNTIINKAQFKIQCVGVWTGFICLIAGSIGRHT